MCSLVCSVHVRFTIHFVHIISCTHTCKLVCSIHVRFKTYLVLRFTYHARILLYVYVYFSRQTLRESKHAVSSGMGVLYHMYATPLLLRPVKSLLHAPTFSRTVPVHPCPLLEQVNTFTVISMVNNNTSRASETAPLDRSAPAPSVH